MFVVKVDLGCFFYDYWDSNYLAVARSLVIWQLSLIAINAHTFI